MSARRRLHRPRVVAVLVLLALCVTAIVALAAQAGRGAPALSLALGAVVTVLLFSPWEWAMHRYVYHRVLVPALRPAFLTHHRDHHLRFFPPWRFTRDGIMDGSPQAHPSVWARIVSGLISYPVTVPDRWVYFLFGAGIVGGGLGLLTRNPVFLLGIALSSAALARLFGEVHGAIHHPGTRPALERRAFFAALRRHHYIHHVDTEANANFLVPLADWALGTLRRSLTDDEKRSLARRRGTVRAQRGREPGGTGPTYRADGRISRPVSRCSRTWAHHPAVRPTAKVAVNSSRVTPTASRRRAV